jgi:hemerythrin-like domain-containing protein
MRPAGHPSTNGLLARVGEDSMNIDRFMEQHREIRAMLEGLLRHLGPGNPDLMAARQSLVSLAAVLNIHLTLEDQALYPTLLKHPEPKVQAKAKAFMEEMGGLKIALTGHLQRWTATERVKAEPASFQRETLDLVKVLKRRLDAEDGELYPMLAGV